MDDSNLRAARPQADQSRVLGIAFGIALAGLSGLGVPTAAHAQSQTVGLSGPAVAVYNLAGRVSVVPGSGSDVTVEVSPGGSDGDALEIQTGPLDIRHGDWGEVETLRVIYPSDRIHYDGAAGRSQLRVRDDGTFWGGRGWRDGREVEVGDRVDGLDAHADLRIGVPEGKRVRVALAVGAIEARNVRGDLYLDTGSGEITTGGTTGELTLDTGSGNVRVDGAEGELSIDTGSGGVDVRSVRGPEISIDTGSGSVRIDGAEAPAISIDTGSGDVELHGARTGRVEIDTGSGEVSVETTAGSASITVDTGSGDVTLLLPGDYAGSVRLETSSGRLRTDLPITLTRSGDDEIEGRIGEGGTARIEVETGSGDISIGRS